MKEIIRELYKGYSIEPEYTIYGPKLQIVNINDCDDFVRYANTLDEAKEIIDEILEEYC